MTEIVPVTTSTRDGVVTIAAAGELTLFSVEQFNKALSDAVASGDQIVVDFRQASYIDTAFVAALVLPSRKMLERGGRLKVLVTEGAYPQYVLRLVGFHDLMDIEAEQGGEQTER